MCNLFNAFADKVRLNVIGAGGISLLAQTLTIARDGDGRICALTFEELEDEPDQPAASAAATEAHLRQPMHDLSADSNYVGQPSPGAAVDGTEGDPGAAAPVVEDDVARAARASAEANGQAS